MKETGSVIVGKRVLIKKASSQVFIAVIVASVVVSFSLVLLNFLWGIKTHNDHVLAEKNKAKDILKSNSENIEDLEQNFLLLDNSETVNARTVIDALPSKYDFPALAASIEGLVKNSAPPVILTGFTGADQQAESQQKSANPQPVEIQFTVTVKGPYPNVQEFIKRLQKSIRPMKITNIKLSGTEAELEATIDITTYYQPAQDLTIETRTVE